jgi:TonB family protein
MKLLIVATVLFISMQTYAQNDTANKAVPFVQTNPQFPGGDAALINFIQQNIHYPEDARLGEIEGKVLMRFVVMEDGSISDVQILRSVYPSVDAEAKRVVSRFPKFTPGTQQGKPVRVYYNLPVVFRLSSNGSKGSDSGPVYSASQVEFEPYFPGGDAALTKFINKNMIYPDAAKQKGIEGKEEIKFIIYTDGSLTDIHVAKPLDPDLDAEAIRLVKLLPKFKPGYKDGAPVKTYYNQSVKFKLPK